MYHRPLRRTGVTVSQLCLGAMMFGDFGNPKQIARDARTSDPASASRDVTKVDSGPRRVNDDHINREIAGRKIFR